MNNLQEYTIKYLKEITNLFIEMAPYLMLGFLISSILYIFVSKDKISNNLGKGGIGSIVKAALFGVPMPLCSCGVIPVASSLYNRGATKGATLSFLISTPQTGVDSILMTAWGLGTPFAIIRPIVSFVTGVLGGAVSELTQLEDYQATETIKHSHNKKTLLEGIKYGFITLPQDIVTPLLKGILLAALITTFLPSSFFETWGLTGITGLFAICLVAIPMYTCATASVPFAAALIGAGADPGAAFVFLMAGPATNLATISVIKKIMGNKTLYIYLGTIFISAIIAGILINYYIPIDSIPIREHSHMHHSSWLTIASAVLLLGVCMYAIIKKRLPNSVSKESNNTTADLSLTVKGMTCNHCKETVHEAISSCVNENNHIEINLEDGQTLIYGNNLDKGKIISSINKAGFSVGKNT